jgi:hypothetical protein
MKTLSEEVITEKARVEIITAVAIQVHQHTDYPTSAEYIGVCRKLIERYPFLKDKVGNGIVSSATNNLILQNTMYNMYTGILICKKAFVYMLQ